MREFHRRGKWGAGILALPLDDFCPPSDFYPGPYLGQNTPLIRRRIFFVDFGPKRHSKSGEDLFFSFKKTLNFEPKRHSKSGRRPFLLFFRERWILGRKDIPNAVKTFFLGTLVFVTRSNPISAKNRISRCRLWRFWFCPPPSPPVLI